MIFVDDTPGEGWMSTQDRSKYAIAPMFNLVVGGAKEWSTLTIVRRDPCPRCGVRGDIGCKHRSAL